ncbi:uncharacterized protein LOC133187828 [Saccostrea echinata]|uniref:uncharacterized protein LOC133187828 n=1 Tax=Saccostrea echinata TaxID=191078 RepID=UPI002A82FC0E|nr:uncharacterized protein LOC133187828 [Saccostrea echinata]
MDWLPRVLTLATFYVIGSNADCSFNTNCTDPQTTTVTARSDDKNFSSVWSTYQVAFFFGVFVLILGVLCVIVIKRKAKFGQHSRQQERQCGLMTAAIYDIVTQSQRTNTGASGSPEIVVHPVKPPSYDEATKDSNQPECPPPSYRESLRQSLNEYPEHFCRNIKY